MSQSRSKRKRGRPRSRSAPAISSPKKTKKRKQWTNEAMNAAIAAVKNDGSVLRAAKEHGVPRQLCKTESQVEWCMALSQVQNLT